MKELSTVYPVLEIYMERLEENVRNVYNLCKESDVSLTGVIKGCNAIKEVIELFVKQGYHSIGSSRMYQLKAIKEIEPSLLTMLVRIPMLSELETVVDYADISLNSDMETLLKLNEVSHLKQKKHKVVLMADLGDLREGVWDHEEFVALARYVEENLKSLELYGIGTNLGCYGSILPTYEKMMELSNLAEQVESAIGRPLDIVSGGATSSVPLVVKGEMPKKVNHLRVGEGILLARDLTTPALCDLEYMHVDTFILKAQVIEIQEKPSHPVGELYVDAFGNKPNYVDRGMRKRALLGVGRQDFGHHESLRVIDPNMEIVGSSSDHLIVDITESDKDYCVGDIVPFTLYYQAMLFLSRSEDVHKVFL